MKHEDMEDEPIVTDDERCSRCGGRTLQSVPGQTEWEEVESFLTSAPGFDSDRDELLADRWIHPGIYCENCGCLVLVSYAPVRQGPREPWYSITFEPSQVLSAASLRVLRALLNEYAHCVCDGRLSRLNIIQIKALVAEDSEHKVFDWVDVSHIDGIRDRLEAAGVRCHIQFEQDPPDPQDAPN